MRPLFLLEGISVIEGLSAYHAAYGDTYLKVSEKQPAFTSNEARASALGKSKDTVSLSHTAKAILALQSERVSLSEKKLTVGSSRSGNGDLTAGDLSGRDLSGVDLSGVVLRSTNLRGTNFTGAVLRGASLANADVTGAFFYGADLRGTNLSGVVGLTPEQLRSARVDSATLLPVGVVLE